MKLAVFLLVGFVPGLAEARSLSLRSHAGGVVSEKEDLPAPSRLEPSSSSKTADDRSLTGLFSDASEEVVGACPYDDTDACTVWTDLRDGYADLFDVSLEEADPDVWMLNMILDGAGAGIGPHGPFSYAVVTESEDLTDQVKQEILNQGGSISDIEDYDVTIRMGELSLTVGVKSWGVGGSLLSFDPSTAPPDADPAWPIKFLVDHVDPDASDERRLAVCSTNPDDYECEAPDAPACEPSCDDDPLNGNDMDVPCWDNAAQIACNTYKTNMANACRTYNTDMENCAQDHKTQQAWAGGLYIAAILGCAASAIWSFGVAPIPCLIVAKTAHLGSMGAFLLAYKDCKSAAANTLDTNQQNAENTRITDLENAMTSCCTVSCGTTTTTSTGYAFSMNYFA